MDSVEGRRKRNSTSPKKLGRSIGEVAEERRDRLLTGMFKDVTDEPSARRFSYAARVRKRQKGRTA